MVVVHDGAQAVPIALSGDVDVVLMDCHIPVLDGFAAARQIRAAEAPVGRRIPIIACSAGNAEEDVSYALAQGMDAYVPKPIDRARLQAELARWLDPASRVA